MTEQTEKKKDGPVRQQINFKQQMQQTTKLQGYLQISNGAAQTLENCGGVDQKLGHTGPEF